MKTSLKSKVFVIAGILALVMTGVVLFLSLIGFNKQIFDTTYKYVHAWIELPGGEVIEGKVDAWKDFDDGDQLQIIIDGKTYLTDTTRAVLRAGD